MNGKFRVWDGMQYHYNVALVNGIAMREENPLHSDRITVNGIHYYSDWAQYKPIKWYDRNKKGDVIVEHCTGLTDKNGKEIYEGDILRHRFGENYEYERELEVFWHKENARFAFILDELNWRYAEDLDEVEIIGNIHEVKP